MKLEGMAQKIEDGSWVFRLRGPFRGRGYIDEDLDDNAWISATLEVTEIVQNAHPEKCQCSVCQERARLLIGDRLLLKGPP